MASSKANEGLYENLTPADLLDMKNRLHDDLQQLLDAQFALNQETEIGDLEEMLKRAFSLKSQLVEESTCRSWCELRLKRIEMAKLLCNTIFIEQDAQSVKNNLEKLNLAQQVIRIEKETSELEKKLAEQNSRNCQLKTENMELMRKLKENKEKRSLPPEVTRNREYKRLKSELDVQCQSIAIYKNIIQKLVVGLGIDLNEDEALRDLVEKCGESLTL